MHKITKFDFSKHILYGVGKISIVNWVKYVSTCSCVNKSGDSTHSMK